MRAVGLKFYSHVFPKGFAKPAYHPFCAFLLIEAFGNFYHYLSSPFMFANFRSIFTAENCIFKVNSKNTRTMSMRSFWCLYCYLWTYFTLYSSVSIVNFHQVWSYLQKKILNEKLYFLWSAMSICAMCYVLWVYKMSY